jgi:L-methionine (R)-S-oxide reductase
MATTSGTGELLERYARIEGQLREQFRKTADPIARMATTVALLHHKLDHYFWTGFYRLVDGDLVVGPYQGTLACQVLERGKGVCWAAVQRNEVVVVPDVHAFPGHIACDSRSRSEIVAPVRSAGGVVLGVLDVDSDKPASFGDVDAGGLARVAALIHSSF